MKSTFLPVVVALASKVSMPAPAHRHHSLIRPNHQVAASPLEGFSADILDRGVVFKGEEFLLAEPSIDTISALEFVGPVTPGGPDVTLSGSAKDIYEQILELNPSYDVFDFPESAASLEAQGINRENLESPDLTTPNPSVAARNALAKRNVVSLTLQTAGK